MADTTLVTCLECGTKLGGKGQPDPYKHLLHCLNVEPDALHRIKSVAQRETNSEHGRRVIHIVDAIEGVA